ncbi:class I SAM-dependent methyltransferase [Candidatus Falkowbacteria bacterium]|nr:class I SAM-dependent methyltransferase [Candidatus Falkowbacteria bacterium]
MKQHVVNRILHQTRETYNRIASDFSDTRSKWWPGFGNFAKYAKPGDKVLDLGCGNGRMATIFAEANISYLGFDNSLALIKIARDRFKEIAGVRFEMGDIINLELKEKDFNLVFLIAVLHHLPTKELRLKVLKDIYNLMAQGGRLVIYNWNLWSLGRRGNYWRYLFDFADKIKLGVWGLKDAFVPWKLRGDWQPRYVHSFFKGELKKLLQQAGFAIEDIYYESRGMKSNFFRGRNLVAVALKK